jgi:hypothetical protein
MDFYLKKLTDEHDGDYWMIFKHGEFARPVLVLNDFDAKKMAFQILELEDDGDPKTLEEAKRKEKEAWDTVDLLFKQIAHFRTQGKEALPLMKQCPNCDKKFSAATERCDSCEWPSIS